MVLFCLLSLQRPPGGLIEMPKPLSAEDILPIVACLTPQERGRLMRLIAAPLGGMRPCMQRCRWTQMKALIITPTTGARGLRSQAILAWICQGWKP